MSEFEKDLANVMGSFIQTELDCVEKQNQEIEQLQQQRDLYKDVIEEVREYIDELYDNTDDITCYDIDKNRKEFLLQILDKAKGEDND